MGDKTHITVGTPDQYAPTYGDPKVTTSNDVAFEKGERHGAKQGILSTQKEVGGQSYPGRALPPVQSVTDAKCEEGATLRAVKKQVGENRHPINEHAEKHKNHGPNN